MKFVDFIKKYRKLLGTLLLLIVVGIVILTQVKFISPDGVREEAQQYIVEDGTLSDEENSQVDDPLDIVDRDSEDTNIPDNSLGDKSVKGNNPQNSSIVTNQIQSKTTEVNKNNNSDSSKQYSNPQEKKTKSTPTVTPTPVPTITPTSVPTPKPSPTEEPKRTKLKDYLGEAWNHTGGRYVALIDQKVDESVTYTVYVTVDCLEVFEDGVECNDKDAWKYIPDDGYIVPKTKLNCHKGENVWDAVATVLNANGIDYAYEGDPPFIHGKESISLVYGSCYIYRCNHLKAGNSSEGILGPFGNDFAGWTFKVNGVYPGLGMNGVVLKDNDNIELKYYTGYNPFQMDETGNF